MQLHEIKDRIQELEDEIKYFEDCLKPYENATALHPTMLGWQEKIKNNKHEIDVLTEKLFDLIQPPKSVGRPSLGVTKKVSITLPKEVWNFIDRFESKSAYFRSISLEDYQITEDTNC